MSYSPTVSVVMPIYKHSKTQLAEAIYSILNQTFKDLELIIVDGSFDDENFNFVSSIKDERIRYFKTKGYINCLNLGIEKSKGRYIARMDSDDFSYPTRIEEQVSFLENNPDVDVCSCLVKFYGDDIEEKISEHKYQVTLLNFINHHEFVHTAMMFRKSINVHYDNLKPVEDCLLYRKLLLAGYKFEIIDKVLLKSFHSRNSIESKYPKYILFQLERINIYALSKYYDFKLSFVEDIFKKREFSKSEIIEFLNLVHFLNSKIKPFDLDIIKITTLYFSYILSRYKNKSFLLLEPLFYKTFFKSYLITFLKDFLKNIFSITNEYRHASKRKENKQKVLTVFGIKYRFKNKK